MWDQRIAYKLLWEFKIKDHDSRWKGWFSELPKSYSTPFYWKESQLDELQYDSLRSKVINQRSSWKKVYDKWQLTGQVEAKQINFEMFVWALQTVNSRAFSGKFEGTNSYHYFLQHY